MGRKKSSEKNFDDLTNQIKNSKKKAINAIKPTYMKSRKSKRPTRIAYGEEQFKLYDNYKDIGYIVAGYNVRIYVSLIAINGVKSVRLQRRYYSQSDNEWKGTRSSINIPILEFIPLELTDKVNPTHSIERQFEHYQALDKPPRQITPAKDIIPFIQLAIDSSRHFKVADEKNEVWMAFPKDDKPCDYSKRTKVRREANTEDDYHPYYMIDEEEREDD